MSGRIRSLAAAALIGAGALMMVVGILRGEHSQLWNKAVHICLECIGVG